MYQYQNEYLLLKQYLWKYRKDDMVKKRGMFLKGVMYDHLNGKSITIACEQRGKNRKYFYFWMARLRQCNFNLEALKGHSKRPKFSPNEIDEEIIDLAEEIRGDDEIGGHHVAQIMRNQHGIKIAGSTICNHFRKRGISKIYAFKKVNRHTKRYAKENPLERAQTDTSWSGFENNYGNRLYFIPVIDDCTRMVTVHVADSKGSLDAVEGFRKFCKEIGIPEVIQTDNGVEFTNKYISEKNIRREKEAKISAFEQEVADLKIRHFKIAKGTPELNGKVERFNRTIKKAMQNRLWNGVTLFEAQKIVDQWVEWYNKIKPHSSLKRMTPYQKFYGIPVSKSA